MNLMDLFYPAFVPPTSVSTVVHKIGFSSERRYVEPKPHPKRVKDPDAPNASEDKALKILKRKAVPMTSSELAPLMKMTHNHAGILLTSLFKKGKLSRVKFQKPGTRYYRYTVADES